MDIGQWDRASSPRQNWHLSKLRGRRQTNHSMFACCLGSLLPFPFFPMALSFRRNSLVYAVFFPPASNISTSTFIIQYAFHSSTHSFLQLNHRPSIQTSFHKMAVSSFFHCSILFSFVSSILFFTLYTPSSWFLIASGADANSIFDLIVLHDHHHTAISYFTSNRTCLHSH